MRCKWLTLGVLAVLAGCGGDSATKPDTTSFTGTWNLKTVNGSQLPFVVAQSGQNSVTVTADVLTIADGGTWSETTTLRVVNNGQTTTQTAPDGGTWVRSGSSLALSSTQGSSGYSGSFTSSQLTFSDGTFAYVFTR